MSPPAQIFPRIRICCPCSSDSLSAPVLPRSPTRGDPADDDDDEDDSPFDPRHPRAAFSLYPLDHLLYCEDCNQVRCPRCVHDEIVCYFCPHCLFEVPSSTVKSEGNRCTRNCFFCPICSAILSVTATGEPDRSTGAPTGPYILLCNHCQWTTREIGIEFEKPTSITVQLAAKLRPASLSPLSPSTASPNLLSPSATSSYFAGATPAGSELLAAPGQDADTPPQTAEEAFFKLRTHYASLKAAASSDEYGSGGSLSRLMGLYNISGGGGGGTSSRIRSYGTAVGRQPPNRRDAWTEYPHLSAPTSDDGAISALRAAGYAETTTQAQRLAQAQGHDARLLGELRPIAALLRTKRSKRCRLCRHILVKPESKVGSTRFRIKLVAMNYIPALSFSRRDAASIDYRALQPGQTHQFLLTVTNPLFDPVSITLATPRLTPGQHPATVTILCPEFEVGANSDIWEEALGGSGERGGDGGRGGVGKKSGLPGQIWDSGRNWTTVCIEIVPPVVPEGEGMEGGDRVVMVPILVRAVYETEVEADELGELRGGRGEGRREKREHSYWSVVEVGVVAKRVEAESETVGRDRPVSMMMQGGMRSPVDVALGKGSRLSMR